MTTSSWMMARHLASVASPAKQHGHWLQPQWGWPSGQTTPLRPCASSRSPHLAC
uniref:Uncharacterized protein n=2 Tax=Colobinae TaxID=9569 RepID=A0A2K6KVG4_RHIBE